MGRRLGCEPTTGVMGASGGGPPTPDVDAEFLVPFGTANPVVTTGSFPQLGFGDIVLALGNQSGLITIPYNGVAELLIVRLSRPIVSTQQITYTVYHNLAPTSMSVVMQANMAAAAVSIASFAVAIGDTLSLHAQTVNANVAVYPCAGVVVRPN